MPQCKCDRRRLEILLQVALRRVTHGSQAEARSDAAANADAPRGALFYPRVQPGGTEAGFLDLMAYLDLKGEGYSSMPGNQWSCSDTEVMR